MENERQLINLNVTVTDLGFSPKGDCTKIVVDHINNAKKNIYVQAFSFTSEPIANALVAAYKRGIEVRAILDKGQKHAKKSEGIVLAKSGIPVQIDDKHAIAHNKVIIIDEEYILTGSFNFTFSAQQNNAENAICLRSKDLASIYLDNWKHHSEHSINYNNSKEFIKSQKESIIRRIINRIIDLF